jgi:tetratricopeptide (TPR) repeat protein
MLLPLGQLYLEANRPEQALHAFDRAKKSLPPQPSTLVDKSFLANLARGHALSWSALGDLNRAIVFQQEAVRLAPEMPENWLYLANLYDRGGKAEEAQQAREHARKESADRAIR